MWFKVESFVGGHGPNFFRCHLSIPKRTQRIARYLIYCDMNFGSSSSHVPTVTGKWMILAENLLSSEKIPRLNLGQKSSKSSGYVSQKQWPKRSQSSNQNTFSGIGFSTNQIKFSFQCFFSWTSPHFSGFLTNEVNFSWTSPWTSESEPLTRSLSAQRSLQFDRTPPTSRRIDRKGVLSLP